MRVSACRLRVRQVAGVLALTVGVSALAGCGGSSLGNDSGDGGNTAAGVNIGLLVPQSGVYAPLGEDMKNGFRLALDQAGGKIAGRQANVTTVDEGESPDTGVPAAQGLLDDGVNAVVGVVSSAVALAVRDTFDEAHVPLIVANAGAHQVTSDAASDYVWRTAYNSEDLSGAMGRYVAQQVGGGSVFVIAADYSGGHEHADAFKKTFTEAGGTVAGEAYPAFGETQNYQPYLAQIRQSGAKAVYAFFAGSEAVTFTKQYHDFGLSNDLQLYAPGFLTEGGALAALGENALGVQTGLQYSPQLDTPRNKEFVEAYKAAYHEPPTVYSEQAYDAFLALDQAMKKGTSGPDVVAGLQGITSIDSPAGKFSFNEGHQAQYTYYLRKVEKQGDEFVNSIVSPLN